jgi:hypothetical protein
MLDTKENEMSKQLLASIVGALMLLLAVGALAANASDGVQADGQSATSEQQASAASGTTQIDPSNTNIDVRVLSPGDNGSVTQTNSATSNATSSNSNSTDQDSSQNQGSGGVQLANQWAGNTQIAGSLSTANQVGATNTNVPVRVLSPGNDGNVTQSNTVSSTASSTNHNTTNQDVTQNQGGSSCGCQAAPSGIQTSGQSAASGQGGAALSGATQAAPTNAADPTAVGSLGSAGNTSQSNAADSNAQAHNTNGTDQDAGQSQAGSGSGIQTSDQSASNEQLALAGSSASQLNPTNTNISVRVLSPGNDGNVTQTNSVSSTANASNSNWTDQSSNQDPTGNSRSCGCSAPSGIQVAQQQASNEQVAGALSAASQSGAKNENIPVRVLSPGNGGTVTQSNDVTSHASATNSNGTDQSIDQDQSLGGCGCQPGGLGIQIANQSSWNGQGATALSFADQRGASNDNSPVRVLSQGNDGRVSQSNSADSTATAANWNHTDQDADQSQHASGCGCSSGLGIQALGQQSQSEQGAIAASAALQDFGHSECGCHAAGNSNGPVRVWSPGSDGSVSQSNSADSRATATNSNSTDQDASQHQSGGFGIGIQALGQDSRNGQGATALSGAFQLHPSNTNDPTRVYSSGGGGSVSQSNAAHSTVTARNTNDTDQDADQSQHGSGGCGCAGGLGIQALGQSATNLQSAFALSAALQVAPHNANGGAAVWSPGAGPFLWQLNDAGSRATGTNHDDADQDARQYQS